MDENLCAQCGTATSPGAKYCESCGAPLAAQGPQRPAQGPPAYQAPAFYTGARTSYQGVAIRFVAILIDYVIISIIAGILVFPFLVAAVAVNLTSVDASAISLGSIAAASVVGFVVWFLYFTLLEGHYGQTIGKMALNIKVVREADGAPIDYGEAAVRTILRIIDGLFDYLIGAIFIWTSDEKQRLGDRVAHTVVVSK
ncbi:MAG: RDD family protein, partial [Halobacteriota archaeon]